MNTRDKVLKFLRDTFEEALSKEVFNISDYVDDIHKHYHKLQEQGIILSYEINEKDNVVSFILNTQNQVDYINISLEV